MSFSGHFVFWGYGNLFLFFYGREDSRHQAIIPNRSLDPEQFLFDCWANGWLWVRRRSGLRRERRILWRLWKQKFRISRECARGSRAYEQTAQDQEVSSPFSDQYTPTTSNNNLKLVFPLKSNPTVNKERKRTKTNTDNYTLQNNLSLKKKVQFSAIFSHFGHLSSHILIGGIINATHSA